MSATERRLWRNTKNSNAMLQSNIQAGFLVSQSTARFHSIKPAAWTSLDATNLDFFSSFLAVFMEIIDDKQEEMICIRERLLEPCLVISFIKVFVKLLSNYLRFIYLCVMSAAVAPGLSLSLSLWAKESSLLSWFPISPLQMLLG